MEGSFPISALLRDSLGNLYGTTTSGGTAEEGTVFEFAPCLGEPAFPSCGSSFPDSRRVQAFHQACAIGCTETLMGRIQGTLVSGRAALGLRGRKLGAIAFVCLRRRTTVERRKK